MALASDTGRREGRPFHWVPGRHGDPSPARSAGSSGKCSDPPLAGDSGRLESRPLHWYGAAGGLGTTRDGREAWRLRTEGSNAHAHVA